MSSLRNSPLCAGHLIVSITGLLFALCGAQQLKAVEAPICLWRSNRTLASDSNTCPHPSDGNTYLNDWTRWSFQPSCVPLAGELSTGSQYCVFTSLPFRSGYGISILTIPELALDIVDSLDDASVPSNLTSHASSPMHTGDGEASFVIKDIPQRGKALVSRRKIYRGEIILVDFAGFVVPSDYHSTLRDEQKNKAFHLALSRLPQPQRATISALSRGRQEDVEDILRVRAIEVELYGTPYLVIFPTAARINHGCRPNSFWRFGPSSLALEVIAMREIQEGEEITRSYIAPGQLYQERRRALKEREITCTCPLCSSPPDAIAESDKDRARIHEIHHTLETTRLDVMKIGELIDELLTLLDGEALWLLQCQSFQSVARAYEKIGDLDNAKVFVIRAETTCGYYGGRIAEDIEDILEYARSELLQKIAWMQQIADRL